MPTNPDQPSLDVVGKFINLDDPVMMEKWLNPPDFKFMPIWERAVDWFLANNGPIGYIEDKTLGRDGASDRFTGLYHEMVWGAKKAYDHDPFYKISGRPSLETEDRIGQVFAWAMVWPKQNGYHFVDMREKIRGSQLEHEGMAFPGLAKAIVATREGVMGDQFAMWKLATHGLTSIIKDPGIRGQYSTALLSDILTLNALKYNPQLGNLPENVQPDLIGWLSNLWNNPQDNYAVYGNIDDPQAFHQAGFNAVGVLIDNLLKYEIQPHDARRHNALFNVIEYYMELDRREAVSGLTRLLDVEEEDVRSTVVEYLHNFAQEYSNEVINQFHELAVGQEEERIVAAKIMAFLPKKQRNIGLYNDVNKLTDDPSYEVRQYALVSAGQIEGDKHTMSPLRTRLRNLIERRRTDDHADVRIYLYSHLPQVVSPDLALAVCEQGFSEMGMEFHENIIKGFHAAVSKWIDSGELAREPLKSKVWAFFKKWQSEIGDEVIPLTPQERLRASLMFPGTGAR